MGEENGGSEQNEAVMTAISRWLEPIAEAVDQAIRLEQEGRVPSQGNQNRKESAATVEANTAGTESEASGPRSSASCARRARLRWRKPGGTS